MVSDHDTQPDILLMKRYISIGSLIGLLTPILITKLQAIAPFSNYDFDYLIFWNPIGLFFWSLARLCKSDLCVNISLFVIIFIAWAILGGLLGFLIYKIKQSRNLKNPKTVVVS